MGAKRSSWLSRAGIGIALAITIAFVGGPVQPAWSADGDVIYACVHQDQQDKDVHGSIYIVLADEPCRQGWVRVSLSPGGSGGTGGDDPRIAALEQTVKDLQAQVQTLQGSLALTQYVRVETGVINGLAGPHVIIEGANLHIRSGSGATDDNGTPTGRGNLVIGYNEPSDFSGPGDRAGSHNLIIGAAHAYPRTGGFVAGFRNSVTGDGATVSGGADNIASGLNSSVIGGSTNTAGGKYATVVAGEWNSALGWGSAVVGGNSNVASGGDASVSGGFMNEAQGDFAALGGGMSRSAPAFVNWAAGSLLETQ